MFDFDLEYDEKEIENFQKSGGILPDGRHHVMLDGCRSDVSPNGTPYEELTFRVASGPNAGAEVRESLYQSDKEGGKKRLVLFGHKLGLLIRDGGKFKLAEGKTSFSDCLGAECVIETKQEEFVSKKTGKKGTAARVTFGGIWKTTDPEVKAAVKAQAGGAASAPKKRAVDAAAL